MQKNNTKGNTSNDTKGKEGNTIKEYFQIKAKTTIPKKITLHFFRRYTKTPLQSRKPYTTVHNT